MLKYDLTRRTKIIYNLNDSLIPNGGLFYEEITKYIYKVKLI